MELKPRLDISQYDTNVLLKTESIVVVVKYCIIINNCINRNALNLNSKPFVVTTFVPRFLNIPIQRSTFVVNVDIILIYSFTHYYPP